jgi:hypothetical protein
MTKKRAHRRRKQLARQSGLAKSILNPPTAEAAAFLDALGMQKHGKVLAFPPDRFKPGLARLAIVQAAGLQKAMGSVQGHRSAAARKAGWHLGALGTFLEGCVGRFPHLVHTRLTDQPWHGCHDDLAALRRDHPVWAPGIDADAGYLTRLEEAIAHDERMERQVRDLIAECREMLRDCGSDAPHLAAKLRGMIDELKGELRTYARDTPLPDLSTMPIAGRA